MCVQKYHTERGKEEENFKNKKDILIKDKNRANTGLLLMFPLSWPLPALNNTHSFSFLTKGCQ